jgi:dTDP-glucose 4,6-dehydratase
MKTVLVTGGAGFIASNFIRLLLSRGGRRVVNLDKLTYAGNRSTIAGFMEDASHLFVEGDIADAERVERLFAEHSFDEVVNFAAESHVDRSIEEPSLFITTNVLGVQVLLDASVRHGVSRFVQVSTDEVYGSLGESGLFLEDSPLEPSSPYSSSKAAGDLLVGAWHRTYGLNTGLTRCSNNYGPYQYPEKLIPRMISQAMSDLPLPVYGDGSNIRDWIHVEDHCTAILAVLERGLAGRTYNIGGESERSNLQVVRSILRQMGKPDTLISFVEDRKGHDWRYAIDNARIVSELGWSPSYNFDVGLKSTIEWYLEHKSWWNAFI